VTIEILALMRIYLSAACKQQHDQKQYGKTQQIHHQVSADPQGRRP
jgi:hypothetical protein